MSETLEVKDCNGNILMDGDTIQITQEPPKANNSLGLKQGMVGKKVRLIPNVTDAIECKIDGMGGTLVIKTQYLKKRK